MGWYIYAGIIAVVLTLLILSVGRDAARKEKTEPTKPPEKLTTLQYIQAIVQIVLIIVAMSAIYMGCNALT